MKEQLRLDELKGSILEDLKSRVEDKILEQANFDLLSKLIKNAENKEEAIAIAELGTTYKRTGFHFDKKLEKIGSTIKYFKKNSELSFCQNEQSKTHKLIIGDNYDALLNLSISYKGKIDVIYIDPPYGKDDMGEFADTNYNNAITRDNLLSMLYPRLVLARQLLSNEGVIFCSIDDKNHAYVKCLFDEIFGEENFVGEYVRQSKVGGGNNSQHIVKEHDYFLVYAKTISSLPAMFIDFDAEYLRRYKETDSSGYKFFWDTFARPGLQTKENESMIYSIQYPDGTYSKPTRWIHSKERFEKEYAEGIIRIIKKDNGDWSVQIRQYLNQNGKKPRGLTNNFGGSAEGTSILNSIFKNKVFKYPKPVNFIKDLIKTIQNKNSFILDFFAGSGTTGQAVLELNKEDGGNRTFILCTNNEKTDMNPNGIAIDVTSKRLRRVMTGSCYDGTNDFEWIKKNSPLGDNLDVYDIAEVSNSEQSEGKSAFDVIDEELYGEVKMTPKDKIKWVSENFSVTQKYLEDRT
jgi:adenine-specific DNA-methyltransferase